MRLTSIFILLFIIQMGILIFDNTFNQTDYLDPYGNNSWNPEPYSVDNTTINTNSSLFWNFMINPQRYTSSSLLTQLFISLLTISTVSSALFIGLAIAGVRSDLVLKIPLAVLFFGVGATPIWQLYNLIIREPSLFGCTAGVVCSNAIIASFFISGMLGLLLVLGIISWWTGVDTG